MVGALVCGLVFDRTKKLLPTCIGEVLGTGVLGGMLAYPIAAFILGKDAALFTYVIPFLVSTAGGTVIAAILVTILAKTHAIGYIRGLLAEN